MAARERSEVRREQIVEAALRIIAIDGLGKFTTAAIAKEVGLTDGAIFRHFDSKEDIVQAAIERVEAALFTGFPPKHRDPVERLGRFFVGRVQAVTSLPGVAHLMFSEHLAQAAGPVGVVKVREFQQRTVDFVRGCLLEARSRGRLRDDADVEDLFVLVRGALLALLHPNSPHGDPTAVRARGERVWALVKDAIVGREDKA